ncbi:MAG: HAD-IIIA family hydrolase [Pseudomonadota bacterium]|nr:HAD-IIIA family hydrolase [Pseudomonadota bacterium]
MKIVILDRDGVINEASPERIKSVAELRPIPGSIEAVAKLSQAGFRVFLASNQPGLSQGLFDYDAFCAMNDRLQHLLSEFGGRLDGIAFAPDDPDAPTPMRKPAPGMILDIARRMNVSAELIPVVGDSLRDIQAARAAKARPVLVRTGNGHVTETEHAADLRGVAIYDNLAVFATALIAAQHALPVIQQGFH